MADNEPPPAKRTRYNLRSSLPSDSNGAPSEPNEPSITGRTNGKIASNRLAIVPQQKQQQHHCHAYKLRSHGKIAHKEIQCIEPKRNRKKPSLLQLNPDCLLEMFNHMKLIDLCHLAETCTTLNNLAKYHFRLKHKHFDFASVIDGEFVSVDEASTLLRVFGDQIHSLNVSRDLFEHDVDDDYVSEALMDSIAENCRKNVKVLALTSINCVAGMITDPLPALFNAIEMLTLNDCYMGRPWCSMKNLKVLKLIEVTGCVPRFRYVNYNQLEEVAFNRVQHLYTNELAEFIPTVPTVKRLSIVKCWFTTIKIFEVIKDMEHLEELEFQLNHPIASEEIHGQYLMHLTLLKKLKVLKLGCNGKSVQQLIDGFCAKKIAIEHLELADGVLDMATVRAIAELKTIKVLKFNNMTEFADHLWVPITNGLHQLEEFHIKTTANISQFRIKQLARAANRLTCLKIDAKDFDLSADTYDAILSAVQNRNDKTHLAITIYDDGHLPNPVHGLTEKWLKVNKLDRNANHLFALYPWTPDDFEFEFDEEFDTDDEFDGEGFFEPDW